MPSSAPPNAGSLDDWFWGEQSRELAARVAELICHERFFRGKDRPIAGAVIEEAIPVPTPSGDHFLLFVNVRTEPDDAHVYVVPVRFVASEPVVDAAGSRDFGLSLIDLVRSSSSWPGRHGTLRPVPLAEAPRLPPDAELEPSLLGLEQTNSSIRFGTALFGKLLRTLEPGENAELEVARFLGAAPIRARVPALVGAVAYVRAGVEHTVFLLSEQVDHQGTAWDVFLHELAALFDRMGFAADPSATPPGTEASVVTEHALLIGRRTAELHSALGSNPDAPGFEPEPFAPVQRGLTLRARSHLSALVRELARDRATRSESASWFVSHEAEIAERLGSLLEGPIDAERIRCHGDYHLGQLLFTESDFFIIDFEGEPSRPPSARREKRSPLVDVASMLRSFDYAVEHALGLHPHGERLRLLPELGQLGESLAAAFLRGYLDAARGANFVPSSAGDFTRLLDFFLLEKCLYEIGYELSHRPAWVHVPLRGLKRLLGAARA